LLPSKLPTDTPSTNASAPSTLLSDYPSNRLAVPSDLPTDVPSENTMIPSSTPTHDPSADINLPKGWIANSIEDKSETVAKNDDAAIPLHFWNSVLEIKLKRTLSAEEVCTLNVIRRWSVKHVWKKAVTKCFCSWLRCRTCHNLGMQGFFDSRTKSRKKNDECKVCNTSGKQCKVDHWIDTKGYRRYQWKSNGAFKYRKWFRRFYHVHESTRKEMELSRDAGVDCIKRSIGASM
jgi:hypothetical protein